MEKLRVASHVARANVTFPTQNWGRHTGAGPVRVPRAPRVLTCLTPFPGLQVGPVSSEARHTQVTSWPGTPPIRGRYHMLDLQAYTLVPIVTELPPHTIGVGTSTRHTPHLCGFKQAPTGHHGVWHSPR